MITSRPMRRGWANDGVKARTRGSEIRERRFSTGVDAIILRP
jgi:hypothetical protein